MYVGGGVTGFFVGGAVLGLGVGETVLGLGVGSNVGLSVGDSVGSGAGGVQHAMFLVCSSFPPSSPQAGGPGCKCEYLTQLLSTPSCTHAFGASWIGAQAPFASSLYPPSGLEPFS